VLSVDGTDYTNACTVLVLVSDYHHAGLQLAADALITGFSATPQRTDGEPLPFDSLTAPRNLAWGIQDGYLCDIVALSITSGAQIGGACCTLRLQQHSSVLLIAVCYCRCLQSSDTVSAQ
jgi:hypothetical protein